MHTHTHTHTLTHFPFFSFLPQALKSSPLLETERSLFVMFFTDPQQLSRVMADLTQKVDALAIAHDMSGQPVQLEEEEQH